MSLFSGSLRIPLRAQRGEVLKLFFGEPGDTPIRSPASTAPSGTPPRASSLLHDGLTSLLCTGALSKIKQISRAEPPPSPSYLTLQIFHVCPFIEGRLPAYARQILDDLGNARRSRSHAHSPNAFFFFNRQISCSLWAS